MKNNRLNVAVLGGSGYTGGELLRLLTQHPRVQITMVTADKSVGLPVNQVFPHLESFCGLTFESIDPERIIRQSDLVFMALPHTRSMELVAQFHKEKKPVIDLSADFRLHDPQVYERWYQTAHTHAGLLKKAVYGLPELHRSRMAKARLIAVPGCYPTAAILQLAPLVAKGLVRLDSIVIDAKSGVSGAGASRPLHTGPRRHRGEAPLQSGKQGQSPGQKRAEYPQQEC